MPYSGFLRRAVAFVVDMVLVSIPAMLVFGPVAAAQAFSLQAAPEVLAQQAGLLMATMISWQVVSLVIAWLYFALMESSKKQATLGKMLLGIKVIGKDGGRISFARATGRFFCKIISYITLYIGFLMAAFTRHKRALHDMIAETYVVKKSFEPGQELPETANHWVLLILVSVVWAAFLLGASALSARWAQTPTQQAAQTAAQRLENLQTQNTRLDQPLRVEGATFYQNNDGYRAVVVDPTSNNKFTLFLQRGATAACCQVFPKGDCEETGFESCN